MSSDNNILFPLRLYDLLSEAETLGFDELISWLPCGSKFRIHKPKEFADKVMPKYFRHQIYKSFLRQLSMYRFCRITEKGRPDLGAYYHRFFRRDSREICELVTRQEYRHLLEDEQHRPSEKSNQGVVVKNTTTTSSDSVVVKSPASTQSTEKSEDPTDLDGQLHNHDKDGTPVRLTVQNGAIPSLLFNTIADGMVVTFHSRRASVSSIAPPFNCTPCPTRDEIVDEIIQTFGSKASGLKKSTQNHPHEGKKAQENHNN